MAEINLDQLAPVDFVVVGFPADKADFSGAMADELKKLMDSDTVRVLDLLMVTKGEDGTVAVAELREHDESELGELRSLEADLSLVLALEDVEQIGADLGPGSAAAVLVWENTWAAPFASAIRHSGGELVARGHIPTQALIAAAEEDREAAEAGA
jgi:fructosamine-3-kinase